MGRGGGGGRGGKTGGGGGGTGSGGGGTGNEVLLEVVDVPLAEVGLDVADPVACVPDEGAVVAAPEPGGGLLVVLGLLAVPAVALPLPSLASADDPVKVMAVGRPSVPVRVTTVVTVSRLSGRLEGDEEPNDGVVTTSSSPDPEQPPVIIVARRTPNNPAG